MMVAEQGRRRSAWPAFGDISRSSAAINNTGSDALPS